MRENGYYWMSDADEYSRLGENAEAIVGEFRDGEICTCGTYSWSDERSVVFRSGRLTIQNAPVPQDIGKPVYVIVDDRRILDDGGYWVWNGKSMSRVHVSAVEVGKPYQSVVTARKTLSRLIHKGRIVGDAELYSVYPNGDIARIDASLF